MTKFIVPCELSITAPTEPQATQYARDILGGRKARIDEHTLPSDKIVWDDWMVLALHEDAARGISFTREQVEAWAGRRLTDDQVADLEDALPNSSFPECVNTIVAHMDLDDETCSAEGCDESLDDGEGYDGLCGNHADQAEKAGKWS